MVAMASADYMKVICTWLLTNNHASTSSLNFYRLAALPVLHTALQKCPHFIFLNN